MKKEKERINSQLKKDAEFIDKYFIAFLQKAVTIIKFNNVILYAKIFNIKEKMGNFCWTYFTFFTFWVCVIPCIIHEIAWFMLVKYDIYEEKYFDFLSRHEYWKKLHTIVETDIMIIFFILYIIFHYYTFWYFYCSRYFLIFLGSIFFKITPPIIGWTLIAIAYNRFVVYWLAISDVWFLHIIIPSMKNYRTMEKYKKLYFIYRDWFQYIFVDTVLNIIFYIFKIIKFIFFFVGNIIIWIICAPWRIVVRFCKKIRNIFYSISLFIVRIPLKYSRLKARYYTFKDNYKAAKLWYKQKKTRTKHICLVFFKKIITKNYWIRKKNLIIRFFYPYWKTFKRKKRKTESYIDRKLLFFIWRCDYKYNRLCIDYGLFCFNCVIFCENLPIHYRNKKKRSIYLYYKYKYILTCKLIVKYNRYRLKYCLFRYNISYYYNYIIWKIPAMYVAGKINWWNWKKNTKWEMKERFRFFMFLFKKYTYNIYFFFWDNACRLKIRLVFGVKIKFFYFKQSLRRFLNIPNRIDFIKKLIKWYKKYSLYIIKKKIILIFRYSKRLPWFLLLYTVRFFIYLKAIIYIILYHICTIFFPELLYKRIESTILYLKIICIYIKYIFMKTIIYLLLSIEFLIYIFVFIFFVIYKFFWFICNVLIFLSVIIKLLFGCACLPVIILMDWFYIFVILAYILKFFSNIIYFFTKFDLYVYVAFLITEYYNYGPHYKNLVKKEKKLRNSPFIKEKPYIFFHNKVADWLQKYYVIISNVNPFFSRLLGLENKLCVFLGTVFCIIFYLFIFLVYCLFCMLILGFGFTLLDINNDDFTYLQFLAEHLSSIFYFL